MSRPLAPAKHVDTSASAAHRSLLDKHFNAAPPRGAGAQYTPWMRLKRLVSIGVSVVVAAALMITTPAPPAAAGESAEFRVTAAEQVPTGVQQERPATSYDGTNYLVVWFERAEGSSTASIRGARVSPTGTMLDPGGFPIAAGVDIPTSANSVSRRLLVAWNPSLSAYLVVWQSAGDIRGARVNAAGTVLDTSPIAIATSANLEIEPSLASGGSPGWMIAYAIDGTGVLGTIVSGAGSVSWNGTIYAGSPRHPSVAVDGTQFRVAYYFPASGLIRVTAVSVTGVVGPCCTDVNAGNGGPPSPPGGPPTMANSSDELLVTWRDPNGVIEARRLAFNGTFPAATTSIGAAGAEPYSVESVGSTWAVAGYYSGPGVDVRYLAPDLSVRARFEYPDITQPDAAPGPPTLAAVAYARPDPSGPANGARRVFLRLLSWNAITPTATVASATEGQPLQFKVALGSASATPVDVTYSVRGSGATSPDDFTEVDNATLTFLPGQTEKLVDVPTVDDATYEPSTEYVFIQIDSATGADVDNQYGTHRTASAQIFDNDPPPTLSVADVSVDEGVGTATVTLTLDRPGQYTASAYLTNWSGQGATATCPDDFAFGDCIHSVEATIPAGQTQGTLSIPIVDDQMDEPDERADFRVAACQNCVIPTASCPGTENPCLWTHLTILDDDAAPSMSVDPLSKAEGSAGTTSFPVVVRLSNPSSQTLTVHLATLDGTATSGSDYQSIADQTVTFDPGQTTRTVNVGVVGDTTDELDETFGVHLSTPSAGATIGVADRSITIVDDDGPGLTVGDATVSETAGTLQFALTLSAATNQAVSGQCSTTDGTATAGADYTAATAPYAIPVSATGTTVDVQVADDALDEADETMTLTCTSNTAAQVVDGIGVGTILDDDAAPTITLTVPADSGLEGDAGTKQVEVHVELAVPSGRTVTASVTTADGSASAPADYTAADVPLSFAPGETTKTVPIEIAADTLDEIDESFTITLASVVGATPVGPTTSSVTIQDDDGPVVTIADSTVAEGNAGSTPLAFTLTLSTTSPQDVTGTCSTQHLTTSAGDYQPLLGSAYAVPAGQTSTQVIVSVAGDAVPESDEALTVVCGVDRSGEIGDGTAIGVIVNDDVAEPNPPPAVVIVSTALRVNARGTARVGLACNTGTGSVSGRVALTTKAKFLVGGVRRKVVLGRAPYAFGCSSGSRVGVRLTKTGLRIVRSHHRIRVIISAGAARRTVILRG